MGSQPLPAVRIDPDAVKPVGSIPIYEVTLLRAGEAPMEGYGRVTMAADVARLMTPIVANLPDEHLYVIPLSQRHDILGIVPVCHGTVSEAQVSMQQIMRVPLLMNAPAMVVVHNHPSGEPSPSAADIHLTRQIVTAGKLMDVRLVDHVIVCARSWSSLRESGLGFDGI